MILNLKKSDPIGKRIVCLSFAFNDLQSVMLLLHNLEEEIINSSQRNKPSFENGTIRGQQLYLIRQSILIYCSIIDLLIDLDILSNKYEEFHPIQNNHWSKLRLAIKTRINETKKLSFLEKAVLFLKNTRECKISADNQPSLIKTVYFVRNKFTAHYNTRYLTKYFKSSWNNESEHSKYGYFQIGESLELTRFHFSDRIVESVLKEKYGNFQLFENEFNKYILQINEPLKVLIENMLNKKIYLKNG